MIIPWMRDEKLVAQKQHRALFFFPSRRPTPASALESLRKSFFSPFLAFSWPAHGSKEFFQIIQVESFVRCLRTIKNRIDHFPRAHTRARLSRGLFQASPLSRGEHCVMKEIAKVFSIERNLWARREMRKISPQFNIDREFAKIALRIDRRQNTIHGLIEKILLKGQSKPVRNPGTDNRGSVCAKWNGKKHIFVPVELMSEKKKSSRLEKNFIRKTASERLVMSSRRARERRKERKKIYFFVEKIWNMSDGERIEEKKGEKMEFRCCEEEFFGLWDQRIGLLAFLDYSDASRLSGSEFTTRAIVVVVCRAFLLIHPRDKLTQSSSLFAVRRIFVNYRGRDYVENVEAEKKTPPRSRRINAKQRIK